MKFTTFLFFIAVMQVSASTFAQKVNLSEKNAPLVKVFEEIRAQTGYDFLVSTSILTEAGPVTIQIKNADLGEVLDQIFKGRQLDYKIDNQSVIISRKEPTILEKLKSLFSTLDITGKITDETGQPLPGATVIVKGTSNSTITDAKGNFSLKHVDNNAVLKISFIGYLTKEINANSDLSNIKMEVANSKLDEVKVIAYGTTTDRLSTGDISTVSAKEIGKQSVNNPLLALEGRVPGLFIVQANGFSGGAVTVRIQGQNSMTGGSDPFYVIDGVPYTSTSLPVFNNIQTNGVSSPGLGPGPTASPLSFINPNDIESISVLKDADATSIYGSRAANGAIIITTKKGKPGQTTVDFNLQSGYGQEARRLGLMNTQQYLQMRNEALQNDGIAAPGPTDYDLNGIWNKKSYTDWQKVLLGGSAKYTDLQGSVSGGSTNTQFLVGTNYHKETTVFPGDFSDQKGSLHFSINNSSVNQKFKFQLTGSDMFDDNKLPSTDLTGIAVLLAPDAPSLYNKDGSLNWAPDQNGNSSWSNPLANQYNASTIKTNNLIANALVSYELLPGLNIKSSFGYTNLQINETLIAPSVAQAPENRASYTEASLFGNNNINSWIVEPQVTYNRAISKGKLEAIIGETIEQNNSLGRQDIGIGYSSDLLLGDIGSASRVIASTTANSIYKYNAGFGRLNYNWEDKYIINLTARRDGSSRFGANSQFHDFASVGGAWIFSKEEIIKNNLSFLSYGKLRMSYGTTGNDQINNYQYLSLYGSTFNAITPYQGVTGLQSFGLSNPYIQWEETKKISLGLNLGFLNDNILLGIDYFINRSSNQLLPYKLPVITGYYSILENFPAILQNSGWEFSVATTNIKAKDFNWNSSINLTIPRNKLIAFPNLDQSSYSFFYVIGQPINLTKVFNYKGVDPATGEYQFLNSHGQLTSTPDGQTDLTSTLNTNPQFYGGFRNSFSYKDFQLDIFFQFVKQIGHNDYFGSNPGSFNTNQPSSIVGAWQNPGQLSSIQRYNSTYSIYEQWNDANSSNAAYSDASYIRLKNLSFSWQLPKNWSKAAHLGNARLFVQGQNLLTVTKYKGLDPETASSASLPPLKVITFGVQITL